MIEVVWVFQGVVVNLLPILSVITGILLIISSVHKEVWGDVLFFPLPFCLGVILVVVPMVILIVLCLVQL